MTGTALCANGCKTRPDSDGNRRPVQADSPGLLCRHCDKRLHTWLTEIPDRYALLPRFLEPGSVDRNPEASVTKQAHPPVPLRLRVVDLLDTRPAARGGWHWRGTIGLLTAWADLVREQRHITTPDRVTVSSEAALLLRHRLWIVEQEWVALTECGQPGAAGFYPEMRALHSDLTEAAGLYRRRKVGTCTTDTPTGECGGPILPSDDGHGGVHCPRCGRIWALHELAHLGRVLTAEMVAVP